ncbi:MAG: S41 family peptidase [Betaproteobacteria bacterium]
MSAAHPGRHRAARCLLAGLLALAANCVQAADAAREHREDFEQLWRAVDSQYAYFDGVRAQCRRGRDAARRRAEKARSRAELVDALEASLQCLHDDHVSLSERTPRSPRRVPGETDLWARWKDGAAVIESVRVAGDADVAGVRPGEVVTHIDGVPVAKVVERMLGGAGHPDEQARDWALRHALAGPREGAFVLDLGGTSPRRVEIERRARAAAPATSILARRMGEERDLGYVRLKNLEDATLPGELDGALGYVKDTRALIVDLRDATSGSRAVTLGVLARFARAEGPWQILEGRDGKRSADRVAPAPSGGYRGPVIVLVDRWTAGEGEALAAGLVAVANARVIGTRMAGLRGELREARLPHSGIVARFAGERTLLVDGTPREALRPQVEIDPAAPSGGPGDPILYQALKLLEK